MERLKTFQELITEEELMDFLKLKKTALNKLRYEGLPFIEVTKQNRVYIVQDVLDFIAEKRKIMNAES